MHKNVLDRRGWRSHGSVMSAMTPEPLREDWRPTRDQVNALLELPGMPPRRELKAAFQEFRLYWMHGRGAGVRRTDKGWAQAWGNWCRNLVRFQERERERSGRPAVNKPSSYLGRIEVR